MESNNLYRNYSNNETKECMPLTMALPGKAVTLVSINGGRGVKMRLYSMGLTPGVPLKVLNSGAPGPFLVAVRDFKIALGYGMAKKIIVR